MSTHSAEDQQSYDEDYRDENRFDDQSQDGMSQAAPTGDQEDGPQDYDDDSQYQETVGGPQFQNERPAFQQAPEPELLWGTPDALALWYETADQIQLHANFTTDDGTPYIVVTPVSPDGLMDLHELTGQAVAALFGEDEDEEEKAGLVRRSGRMVAETGKATGRATFDIVANPKLDGKYLASQLNRRGWGNVPWLIVALVIGLLCAVYGVFYT